MKMEKPLPCPFCGAQPTIGLDARSAFVECTAKTKTRLEEHTVRMRGRAPKTAVKRWNTRVAG